MNDPCSLVLALARWEACSGRMRRLCNLPYQMEEFVAGFILGTMDDINVEAGIQHSSFRVGYEEGVSFKRHYKKGGK